MLNLISPILDQTDFSKEKVLVQITLRQEVNRLQVWTDQKTVEITTESSVLLGN